MQVDLVNSGLAFLEGLGLIVSPCILPILPIILSASVTGDTKRPYGIILGFVITFALLTYFSRLLVQYTGIDLGLIRHLSYILLILFGLIMISTTLTEKFILMTQRLMNVGANLSIINNPKGGWISGLFFGSLVGIIWTPCAGPILAAVIIQTVIQETSLSSFLTLLAFGLGAGLPMLAIALLGRKLMVQFRFIQEHGLFLRKILGAIIILAVFYMIYSEGTAASYPGSRIMISNSQASTELIHGLDNPYPAPPISGITTWINSPPIELNQLKGKIVLIDFWTYSCINCVRTIPYLKEWYAKYHKQGLEIIGIHAPEFEFEKNADNVKNAVLKDGILYPVGLDNQFATWRNFKNSYWPAHYLIDKEGNVVYQHFGEGEYDVMENNIRYLLGMKAINTPINAMAININLAETPETYLGYARAERFRSIETISENKTARYSYPAQLSESEWALQGDWIILPDKIISANANASVKIHFNASKVYMVMGNTNNINIAAKLLLNGRPLMNEISVNKHTIYEVVQLKKPISGTLEVIATSAGLEVYTFTFGS